MAPCTHPFPAHASPDSLSCWARGDLQKSHFYHEGVYDHNSAVLSAMNFSGELRGDAYDFGHDADDDDYDDDDDADALKVHL